MSRSVTIDDPEFFCELLALPSHETLRQPDIDTYPQARCQLPHQPTEVKLAKRLRVLLDTLATVLVRESGNPAAVAAAIHTHGGDKPEVHLYFTFNHTTAGVLRIASQHVQSIFQNLYRLPGPLELSTDSLDVRPEDYDIVKDIIRIVHDFCWQLFTKRVNKRRHILHFIEEVLQQDSSHLDNKKLEKYKVLHEILCGVVALVDEAPSALDNRRSNELFFAWARLLDLEVMPDLDEKREIDGLQEAEKDLG
jgi:hypothetical protein